MDQIVHRATSLDLAVEPWDWPFARDNRALISEHFAAVRAERPAIYNGRILLMHGMELGEGSLSGRCFETDFASFLTWRDRGFPDEDVINAFGMGALRGSDGIFLMGEMAARTANAGRIYFPSGAPDLNDVVGDRLDIPGSIAREVEEETGLTTSDYQAEETFACVLKRPLLAIIRILNLAVPAEQARAIILANVARQESPEFSAVHLVRDIRDVVPAMPAFVPLFLSDVSRRESPDGSRQCRNEIEVE
jgi:hypothetical protein